MEKDREYLEEVKGYLNEADQIIFGLKQRTFEVSGELRADVSRQIEEVKRKRVEMQIRLDKAWSETERPWWSFIEEFEQKNRKLVSEYQGIIRKFQSIQS